MEYWPKQLFAQHIRSPIDIMNSAAEELQKGIPSLKASVKVIRVEEREVLRFLVEHPARSMEVNLFEVSHQVGFPYPIAFDPPRTELPEYLRREIHRPSISEGFVQLSFLQERVFENHWVCSSPDEFSDKLKKYLGLDSTMSKLFRLLMDSTSSEAEILSISKASE